jgi:hypothetical protein
MVMAALPRGGRTVGLVGLALVLVGVVCGRAVVETQAVEAPMGVLLLGTVAVLAAVAAMVAGPVPCLAGLAALSIVSPVAPVGIGAGIDVTPADAFFVGLVTWWVVHAAGLSGREEAMPVRAPIRSAPVLVFLAYAGLSLLYVASVDPGFLSVSSVSWLRVVQTALIGWLAATFVRTPKDVSLVLGGVALAGVVAVALALVGATGTEGSGPLGTRGGGAINPNTLGLVSGLLILLAFFPAVRPSLVYRVPFAIIGGVGLVQSASVASLFGTAIALVLGLALAPRARETVIGERFAKAVTAVVLAVAVGYALASLIRPENLPTSEGFFTNSAGQRVILGTAGLEIAANNPVIGVGWQRSGLPEVVGDPEVTTELRARFRDTREDFFPDVEPFQVHNTYVQVPADLGLIGLGLFLVMIWSLGRDISRVAGRAPRDTREWVQLRFLGWALVLILVWMNDNPIFGGQAETVTSALFVGAIAGLGVTMLSAPNHVNRGASP